MALLFNSTVLFQGMSTVKCGGLDLVSFEQGGVVIDVLTVCGSFVKGPWVFVACGNYIMVFRMVNGTNSRSSSEDDMMGCAIDRTSCNLFDDITRRHYLLMEAWFTRICTVSKMIVYHIDSSKSSWLRGTHVVGSIVFCQVIEVKRLFAACYLVCTELSVKCRAHEFIAEAKVFDAWSHWSTLVIFWELTSKVNYTGSFLFWEEKLMEVHLVVELLIELVPCGNLVVFSKTIGLLFGSYDDVFREACKLVGDQIIRGEAIVYAVPCNICICKYLKFLGFWIDGLDLLPNKVDVAVGISRWVKFVAKDRELKCSVVYADVGRCIVSNLFVGGVPYQMVELLVCTAGLVTTNIMRVTGEEITVSCVDVINTSGSSSGIVFLMVEDFYPNVDNKGSCVKLGFGPSRYASIEIDGNAITVALSLDILLGQLRISHLLGYLNSGVSRNLSMDAVHCAGSYSRWYVEGDMDDSIPWDMDAVNSAFLLHNRSSCNGRNVSFQKEWGVESMLILDEMCRQSTRMIVVSSQQTGGVGRPFGSRSYICVWTCQRRAWNCHISAKKRNAWRRLVLYVPCSFCECCSAAVLLGMTMA